MSNPPNRKEIGVRKRWRYLGKRLLFDATSVTSIATTVAFGGLSVLTAAWLLSLLVTGHADAISSAVMLIVSLASVACLSYKLVKVSFNKSESLPYVPPLREQIAALPADEVLLRGADAPAAMPDELVRAVAPSTAEPAEELLRAWDGRT